MFQRRVSLLKRLAIFCLYISCQLLRADVCMGQWNCLGICFVVFCIVYAVDIVTRSKYSRRGVSRIND